MEVIHAHSAPAKGRVERLFGTLQDRLVKEMRLRGDPDGGRGQWVFKTIPSCLQPAVFGSSSGAGQSSSASAKGLNLDSVLCIKTQRTLRNDFTVAHNGKLYQIEDKTRAARVMVHEQIDGSIKIFYQGQALRFGQITTRRAKQESPPVRVKTRTPHLPSPNHPWRNFKFGAHKYERREAIPAANPSDGTGDETDKDWQTGPMKRRRGVKPTAGEIPVALRAPSISPANPGSE